MAPLAARTLSNDTSDGGATGGVLHMTVTATVIVASLLGVGALAAFILFGTRRYPAFIEWCKSRSAALSSRASPTSTLPANVQRTHGGATPPTAALPRFAHNLAATMRFPRPNISSAASRPVSSLRAYPTGMGPSHTRRGSEASNISNAPLLRVSPPPSPKPAFLGRGTATGQRLTR